MTTKSAHYRLRAERPFLASERPRTTVLYGGLTKAHERLGEAGLRSLGYKVQSLPNTNLDAYAAGREHCSNGLCNPAYFTIGSLLSFLRHLRDEEGLSTEEICESYIFYTAGSYGPCRFGMYESEYRFALDSAGFAGFRVLVFKQSGGMVQTGPESGLDLEPSFFLVQLKSFLLGDLVNELYHQVRPYAIDPHAADRAREQSLEVLNEAMSTPPSGPVRRQIEKLLELRPLQGRTANRSLRWAR